MFDRRGCRMLARRVFDRFRRDRDVEPERVYRDDDARSACRRRGPMPIRRPSTKPPTTARSAARASMKQESLTSGSRVGARPNSRSSAIRPSRRRRTRAVERPAALTPRLRRTFSFPACKTTRDAVQAHRGSTIRRRRRRLRRLRLVQLHARGSRACRALAGSSTDRALRERAHPHRLVGAARRFGRGEILQHQVRREPARVAARGRRGVAHAGIRVVCVRNSSSGRSTY